VSDLKNMAGINLDGAKKHLDLVEMAFAAGDEAAAIVHSEKAGNHLTEIRKWAGVVYTSRYESEE
jgi:hypothetical protein